MSKQESPMTRYYTIFGLTLTVVYVISLWVFSSDRLCQLNTMPLNEVGDFLAGAFGPIALLWLILGYFQQGVELKQNTRALELQAEELKNSVQQQRELVGVSRQQFQAEMENLHIERARIDESYKPHFVFGGFGGSHRGDYYHTFSTKIRNIGADVTDVHIGFSLPMERINQAYRPHLVNNEDMGLEFVFENQNIRDCELKITYSDRLGRAGSYKVLIKADLTGEHPRLSIG